MVNISKKSASLGLKAETVGKIQAKKEFFPLVDSLRTSNFAVEITDEENLLFQDDRAICIGIEPK